MTDTVAEVTEPQTEGTDETAQHEEKLEAFKAAANDAVEQGDVSTGTVPEAALEPVKVAWRDLTGGVKFKNLAKNYVGDQIREVLSSGDMEQMSKAVSWNAVNLAIKTAPPKPAAAARPTVSPNKVFADKVQALRLATDLVEGGVLPEGVTAEWEDEIDAEADNLTVAEEYLTWVNADEETRGDEPEVSPVVKQAVKIALGKGPRKGAAGRVGSVHVGPKRDVAKHIEHAFETVETGTFLTVSEIRNIKSAEYGDDAPSAGAINQRLRPPSGKPCTIAGIRVEQNANGTWGATKL